MTPARPRLGVADISDRRLGEEARSRLAAIVENSQDAIISKTLDGVITTWNRAAERMFGYSAEEAVGQHITLLIPPERRPEEAELLRRLRLGELIESYETERVTKDHRLVEVSLTISPLRDNTGRIVGASKIARDIGARKAEERRRLEAEEALRTADRRKDEFLAILAHELRNPLASLLNSLDVLQVNPEAPAGRDLLGIARRQANTLVRLVEDLLDASRIGRGLIELKCEPLTLAEAVELAVEIARPLVQARDQQLRVALPREALRLNADRTRLTQVIANLLNNAAKYTPHGGCIELTARREDEHAELRVSDNGNGIPPEMLSQIFGMFTQVDRSAERSQGGLGIGLSLVKRLVELHGGTVEARSDGAGQGSEFIVRLPLLAAALDTAGPMLPALAPTRRRVLIADDNADAAKSLALLLQTLGQDVHVVHDGQQAVDRATELRPEILLLDIGMPGLTGYDVARRVRAEPWGRESLLVALTGWGQEDDRRRSKEAGFDQHLVKPVALDALCRLLV